MVADVFLWDIDPCSLGESGVRSRHAYLLEEVFAQGLTRNVAAFARCFEAVGYSHGQLTNYTDIARDCGVDAKTVREYYQILCDTLLGRMVLPYRKRQDRRVLSRTPKFFCSMSVSPGHWSGVASPSRAVRSSVTSWSTSS